MPRRYTPPANPAAATQKRLATAKANKEARDAARAKEAEGDDTDDTDTDEDK